MRTIGPEPVNSNGTQLSDPMKSGLTRWCMAVWINGRRRGTTVRNNPLRSTRFSQCVLCVWCWMSRLTQEGADKPVSSPPTNFSGAKGDSENTVFLFSWPRARLATTPLVDPYYVGSQVLTILTTLILVSWHQHRQHSVTQAVVVPQSREGWTIGKKSANTKKVACIKKQLKSGIAFSVEDHVVRRYRQYSTYIL